MVNYSIHALIHDLQKIVTDNPDIDFRDIELSTDSDQRCTGVILVKSMRGAFIDLSYHKDQSSSQ